MKISATTRKCFFFVLLAGIFVWLICVIFHPFEPRYGGKRLSQWATVFSEWPPQEYERATSAIQHIGTNALPYALECCRARFFRIDLVTAGRSATGTTSAVDFFAMRRE